MAREADRRGRLSSIEKLPDDAWPHAVEAMAALKERRRDAEHIREELNGHLLAMGHPPISRSAFSRFSLKLAVQGAKLIRAREAGAMWSEKMKGEPQDEVTLLTLESVMALTYEIVTDHQVNDTATSMKLLKEAALTIRSLALAKKLTIDGAAKRERELTEKTMEAVDTAAKAAGLSAETAEAIKAKILGILPAAVPEPQKGAADGPAADP